MKIIFTDIDGVLNSAIGEPPFIADMEPKKLSLLKSLIDETDASGIVLTSDRRYSKPYMDKFLEALDEYEIYLLGEIRRPKTYKEDPEDNRGKQILDYLENEKEEVERILILDDNDDGISNIFKEDFIQTSHYQGLNEEIFLKAIKILND